MRLFGLPYQFNPSVDPRLDGISETVGSKFLKNMVIEGPVVTFIPGEPDYLPAENSTDKKVNTTGALLEAASDGFVTLESAIKGSKQDDYKLYDFKRQYGKYINYVNALCRAGATFLDIDAQLDGTPLQGYDWRNYRWDASSYSSIAKNVSKKVANKLSKTLITYKNDSTTQETEAYAKSVNSKALKADKKSMSKKAKNQTNKYLKTYKEMVNNPKAFILSTMDEESDTVSEVEDLLQNYNFVQFYVDPSSGMSESFQNSTSESQLKGLMDGSSGFMKDLAFMANSGGLDASAMQEFAGEIGSHINTGIQEAIGGNTIGTALSRIINLGNETLKGNNFIMPDIYQASEYSKSYNITVHLKTPYGTKLGYYLNVFVPMMHLLALALPRQATANSYSSPFIIRAYIDGCMTCNMGIVTGLSISRVEDSWSIDGLASEVDVSLDIQDLYSDMAMSPANSPRLFVNNSSLVEFLATNCGLSLVSPQLSKKAQLIINATKEALADIPVNVSTTVTEKVDGMISLFTGLTK